MIAGCTSHSGKGPSEVRVAACQLNSKGDKEASIPAVFGLLDQAASHGVNLVALPGYTDFMSDNEGARIDEAAAWPDPDAATAGGAVQAALRWSCPDGVVAWTRSLAPGAGAA